MKKQLLSFGASAIAFTALAAGFTGANAEEPTTTSGATTSTATADATGMGGHGHGHRGGGIRGVDHAELAAFLGVEEDALKTLLKGGASLATVATDAGKSREELITFLTSSVTGSLAAKVTEGTITQEEADARLAKFTENVESMIDRVKPAGVAGDRPMRGPRGGGAHAPATDTAS